MLQFFKKGRKRDDKSESNDSCAGNEDEILLEAEQFYADSVDYDSDSPNSNFSKTILQIITDKNCLSYFVQFMDSKKSLPPVKFWLEAESFKTAAEVDICNDHTTEQTTDDVVDSSAEQNSTSNISTDVPNTVPKLSESRDDKLFIKKEATVDLKQSQSMTEMNESDLTKHLPLTDDEKSQLYEQNIVKQNLKNKQESLHIQEVERSRQMALKNQEKQKRINFQSSIASDAIRIFKNYLTTKSPHYIEVPATVVNEISLALCSPSINDDSYRPIAGLFSDAQLYVLDNIEKEYLNQFIDSSFYCKYCVDILTSEHLKIQDILCCEAALFYFMEFLEQEHHREYLDFWIAATNFKKQFENIATYDKQQAQTDALVLYEKYFSLQATNSLRVSDSVRFKIEERICTESDPIMHCFDLPLLIIERYLERKYFKQFVTSQLFYKHLSELLQKIDGVSVKKEQDLSAKKSRHRKTYSDCSSDKAELFRHNTISSQNTLLADGTKKKMHAAQAGGNMQIDSRQLNNPDMLWRRNSISGLNFGRIDSFGRYERDFDMEPGHEKVLTKGNKFRQVVRKLVNLPEEKVQEEIAWQVAEMIVKDITNITLNGSNGSNELKDLPSL
ncbi:A-kinase anchor protein 10, mitochondrial [Bradysia coprophila]|uniref:A-kinase anchor protein 10, mitochondrial n=1 Tax=Bradysia coprophila TaxID=38358 RepID=UPI00187D8493|nr:A-kinase anchor protein 10, mitochondrial [Bradysia coprophila]